MNPNFDVSIRDHDACVTVDVAGELDVATAPQLRDRLESIIDGSSSDVAIDLSGLSFLDSSGLTVLVTAHQRLAGTTRQLTVVNPSKPSSRVLELAGLVDLLDVRRTGSPTFAD